ncbi:exopolysaccharide biosynthesis polyprenyl glycosylphosphotransferase [Acetobacter sp. LMG 1637]|uniref:Exopolysaccharide biosynthesis polyprenyl glycosylphosphotransferase n=1 Tax=Acetobacter fallax TaxID=1737473 RepID=A0ABX0K7E9_9PROT|nr:exopolysaccharide biosynthesis polyprenyl glycosylphosphotransferase [Acetobacter fallax]
MRRFKGQVRYLGVALCFSVSVKILLLEIFFRSLGESFKLSMIWFFFVVVSLFFERCVVTFVLFLPSVVVRLQRKIAIIGSGEAATELAERISHDAGHTYGLFGMFDVPSVQSIDNHSDNDLNALVKRSRHDPLHAIILAFSNIEIDEIFLKDVTLRLRQVLSDIYIIPSLVHGIDSALPVEYFGPSTLFVLQRRPLSEIQALEKSIIDFILALIGVVFLAPAFILVGLAIKLDSSGPVFFRQPRLGKNGREFLVYKFRSMHAHMSDSMADRQTSRGDPRVTRVGRWLRKLSIDEIPQLFNVIQGNMSLVGPRPHAPHTRAGGKLLDDALAEYVLRYHVKPGITGWAQVNGARGELVTVEDLRRRVNYDLEYIRRWSIFFDFKIMFLTIVREVFSRHAF